MSKILSIFLCIILLAGTLWLVSAAITFQIRHPNLNQIQFYVHFKTAMAFCEVEALDE